MPAVYVVTDCQFDGPIPGRNSMLSFGAVAVSETGAILGAFEAVLAALPGAARTPATMAFWADHPEAWTAATDDPRPAEAVMARFVAWIRALGGEPIFAAHPLAVDGPWLDHHLQRFHGRPLFEGPWIADRLFRHPPLCLMSMVAGRTGRPPSHLRCRARPARMARRRRPQPPRHRRRARLRSSPAPAADRRPDAVMIPTPPAPRRPTKRRSGARNGAHRLRRAEPPPPSRRLAGAPMPS